MRNENRCESENNESHILKTSGSENSCDNNRVNHLKKSIHKDNKQINDEYNTKIITKQLT